jgi:hypothetical protein
MTLTRTQGLEFADYLAAQKAIAAEAAAIEDECNAASYDEHCTWHDPQKEFAESDQQCESLRNGSARYSSPVEDVMAILSLLCIIVALIWTVVHLPW